MANAEKDDQWAHVPNDFLQTATFLQSSSAALKTSEGVLSGGRFSYFKGKAIVNALMRDPYAKDLKRPPFANREDAEKCSGSLLNFGLIVKVDRDKKQIRVAKSQGTFVNDDYYVWAYQNESVQFRNKLIGFGILFLIFVGVLFPLWPSPMRTGVYYLSLCMLGLMGLFFGLAIVRLILWVGLKLFLGRGGWLYPNLFADCGVIESFIPTWGWDDQMILKNKKKSS